MAHPYGADLENFLASRKVVYEVRKPKGAGWAARKHELEAVERWYVHGWSRFDGRLRSSIVEGVVVFLSLFDDSPAVHRAFCPPRSAYVEDPKPGEPKPLAPLESLLESGHVLALNFPVGLNPGLARILGVMLKLDFQRAILQRIPQITAHPERAWRDLLFVCDEYHAFATVGEPRRSSGGVCDARCDRPSKRSSLTDGTDDHSHRQLFAATRVAAVGRRVFDEPRLR
jgi:hypothetical protein